MQSSVHANQIAINKSIITFKDNKNISEKYEIKNGFPHKAYIDTELYEIIYPGTKKQHKVIYKSVDKTTKVGMSFYKKMKGKNVEIKDYIDSGIHFTPNKLILEENGNFLDTKSISILNLNESLAKERVYRLKTFPIIAGFKNNNKVTGVKILIQYEILILVQPNTPILSYEVDFDNNLMTIKNKGNSNFILEKLTQCDNQGVNCYELTSKRIYADASHSYKLKYTTPISVKLNFGGIRQDMVFNKG